jgi:hypothetical protein
VRDGHLALVADHGKRLGIEQHGIAGGGGLAISAP